MSEQKEQLVPALVYGADEKKLCAVQNVECGYEDISGRKRLALSSPLSPFKVYAKLYHYHHPEPRKLLLAAAGVLDLLGFTVLGFYISQGDCFLVLKGMDRINDHPYVNDDTGEIWTSRKTLFL